MVNATKKTLFLVIMKLYRICLTNRLNLIMVFLARDIINYVRDEQIKNLNEFDWLSQLRYYWDYDEIGKYYRFDRENEFSVFVVVFSLNIYLIYLIFFFGLN